MRVHGFLHEMFTGSQRITKKNVRDALRQWKKENPDTSVRLKDVDGWYDQVLKMDEVRRKRMGNRPLRNFELIQSVQKNMIAMKRRRRRENRPLNRGQLIVNMAGFVDRAKDDADISWVLRSNFGRPSFGGYYCNHSNTVSVEVRERYLGRYSSRCTFSKVERDIFIEYNMFAYRKIPQVLRDQFVLEAKLFRRVGGLAIYDCKFLKKGRGFNFSIESGKIIVYNEFSYHVGKQSLKTAIRNLRKKIESERLEDELSGEVSLARVRVVCDRILAGEITRFDHLPVTRAVSLRAGNCVPGTDEFIEANSLSGKKISIAEFRECNPLHYKMEYRLALVQAIKEAVLNGKVSYGELNELRLASC
jgi:hypothetical protein